MNIQEADILQKLHEEPFINQRILSKSSGHSLGVVNKVIKSLTDAGYLTDDVAMTGLATEEFDRCAPKSAIILAAGFGVRMVPINVLQPKGLLEVHGEPLIERLITQLHEVGITDITVVVGFMKGSFDYLVDKFGVRLKVNPDYAGKNNLHSLALVADRISNTYIIPSDIWCESNPFSTHELRSWYMVSDLVDDDSTVRVNRKGQLVRVHGDSAGNSMVGIAYLLEDDAALLRASLRAMASNPQHDSDFWEEALYRGEVMRIPAKVVPSMSVFEIDTYEQLRELDSNSNQLKSDALNTIAGVFGVQTTDITDIAVLKKGMTNRSFIFTCKGAQYIMRIPGEGTDQLIDREQEAAAYAAIAGKGLCDDPVFLDPASGYKITRYLDGVRVCDCEFDPDLMRCMEKLKGFHRMRLESPYTFDIFERTDFYESLWNGAPSEYRDYAETKANVFSLASYVESQPHDWCLTHIDAVPDNFLFHPSGDGEALQLTDWEYSGMQDPHVDIAMFSIYSLYDRAQIDHLIDIYFADEGGCPTATRAKIYCYVAMCGLLWSNWCEYKRNLGVEFGEYSLAQYRYGKDFYRYAHELMDAAATEANGDAAC